MGLGAVPTDGGLIKAGEGVVYKNEITISLGFRWILHFSQPAFTCSKLTIETLEQGVKYVQS